MFSGLSMEIAIILYTTRTTKKGAGPKYTAMMNN
jgi:hypothetical protein